MREFSSVLGDASFLEGSRWLGDRIWVSDCYTQRVLSVREDGTDPRVEALVPGNPSGLGMLPDGRLLVASMQDQLILRREHDGTLVTHADLSGYARWQINDMAVDPQGRCWVGCFGFDVTNSASMEPAVIVRVDPDGTVEVVADDVWCPNGSVCDGNSLVVAEFFGNCLTAFDVGSDGSLGNRRKWSHFGDMPASRDASEVAAYVSVTPDGIAEKDIEGAIWVADPFHQRALRVGEGGTVYDEITVKDGQVFDVTLGGSDGHTLFLAVSPSFLERERANTRDSTLRSTRVQVPLA